MKINIIGNSHVVAIDIGHQSLSEEMDLQAITVSGVSATFEQEVFSFETASGVGISSKTLASRVKAITGEDCIRKDEDRLWGLSMGHSPFMLRNPVWRRHVPYHLKPANQRELPISSAVYEQIIVEQHKNVLSFFEQLKRCGVGFFVIASPFPRRNISLVQSGRMSPALAVDIDRNSRRILQDWLQKRGIAFLDAPPQTSDADGFMLPQFCAGPRSDGSDDPHHANGEYGELVIKQILHNYPEVVDA